MFRLILFIDAIFSPQSETCIDWIRLLDAWERTRDFIFYLLIIFLFLDRKFVRQLFIEFVKFGNLILWMLLFAFEFLKYFIPIFLLFFIALDTLLEVFNFKVDLNFFMLKTYLLLIKSILQLGDSMFIFINHHLTLLQVAL